MTLKPWLGVTQGHRKLADPVVYVRRELQWYYGTTIGSSVPNNFGPIRTPIRLDLERLNSVRLVGNTCRRGVLLEVSHAALHRKAAGRQYRYTQRYATFRPRSATLPSLWDWNVADLERFPSPRVGMPNLVVVDQIVRALNTQIH